MEMIRNEVKKTDQIVGTRHNTMMLRSQIDSTVVKAFAFQADGLGFNSPSGNKAGCPGHSKYVWVGQYEPSCLKVPILGPWG